MFNILCRLIDIRLSGEKNLVSDKQSDKYGDSSNEYETYYFVIIRAKKTCAHIQT